MGLRHRERLGISKSTHAWTRDSSYILFEQDQGGDENFHLYPTDPSNPNAKAVREGARAQIIDLPRDRPNEALMAINARDKRYFDAYEIDIASGRSRLLEKNPGDVDAWFADGHGIIRACAAQLGTTTEIRVRDLGSGPFRLLATYSDEESASIHGFGPDGSFLHISSARGSNTERLVTLDLKTGKETVIDEDPEYDLSEVLISDQTNELLGVGYNRERLTYKAFEKQFARDLSALEMVHDGRFIFAAARATRSGGSSLTTLRMTRGRPICTTVRLGKRSFCTAQGPGCRAMHWRT